MRAGSSIAAGVVQRIEARLKSLIYCQNAAHLLSQSACLAATAGVGSQETQELLAAAVSLAGGLGAAAEALTSLPSVEAAREAQKLAGTAGEHASRLISDGLLQALQAAKLLARGPAPESAAAPEGAAPGVSPLPPALARTYLRTWSWSFHQVPDLCCTQWWLVPLWGTEHGAVVTAALLAVPWRERQRHLAALFGVLQAVLAAQLPAAEAAPRLCLVAGLLKGVVNNLPHRRKWLVAAQQHMAGLAAAVLCCGCTLIAADQCAQPPAVVLHSCYAEVAQQPQTVLQQGVAASSNLVCLLSGTLSVQGAGLGRRWLASGLRQAPLRPWRLS